MSVRAPCTRSVRRIARAGRSVRGEGVCSRASLQRVEGARTDTDSRTSVLRRRGPFASAVLANLRGGAGKILALSGVSPPRPSLVSVLDRGEAGFDSPFPHITEGRSEGDAGRRRRKCALAASTAGNHRKRALSASSSRDSVGDSSRRAAIAVGARRLGDAADVPPCTDARCPGRRRSHRGLSTASASAAAALHQSTQPTT